MLCHFFQLYLLGNIIFNKNKKTRPNPVLHVDIAKTFRTLFSFIHNPFCTYIGQVLEMIFNSKIVAKNVSDIR